MQNISTGLLTAPADKNFDANILLISKYPNIKRQKTAAAVETVCDPTVSTRGNTKCQTL